MTGRAHARWTQASWSESWSWDSVQFCGWSGEVRLESLRMMTTCDSCSLVWTGQTWVERPRSLTCVKHRSSRSLWRLSALIGLSSWFLHRSAPSPCTWRGTFIQTSITKKSVFTGLRLFHQTCCIRTVCISVFRINRLHSESLEVLKV